MKILHPFKFSRLVAAKSDDNMTRLSLMLTALLQSSRNPTRGRSIRECLQRLTPEENMMSHFVGFTLLSLSKNTPSAMFTGTLQQVRALRIKAHLDFPCYEPKTQDTKRTSLCGFVVCSSHYSYCEVVHRMAVTGLAKIRACLWKASTQIQLLGKVNAKLRNTVFSSQGPSLPCKPLNDTLSYDSAGLNIRKVRYCVLTLLLPITAVVCEYFPRIQRPCRPSHVTV